MAATAQAEVTEAAQKAGSRATPEHSLISCVRCSTGIRASVSSPVPLISADRRSIELNKTRMLVSPMQPCETAPRRVQHTCAEMVASETTHGFGSACDMDVLTNERIMPGRSMSWPDSSGTCVAWRVTFEYVRMSTGLGNSWEPNKNRQAF
jgi:hypothetical protein